MTSRRHLRAAAALATAALAVACTPRRVGSERDHAESAAASAADGTVSSDTTIAPGAADAHARLANSPRHGEWAMIQIAPGDSVRAWIVYPERSTKAPVVVVVHEIFGLSTWVRAVADQLAADGFIAIAPDLLTNKIAHVSPDSVIADSAVAAIRTLTADEIERDLVAVAKYAMALPAAQPRYGIVGFCWGGGVSFGHAARASLPQLQASVVYYGTNPPPDQLQTLRAPVLGLYGGNDARVDATIPPADSTLRARGRTYQPHLFAGAGHGFLRAQDGQNGANLAAAKQAWPMTIAWFRTYLGR